MMSVLDAFRIRPFDLDPIFVSWTDAPRFLGNPKKDSPVNDWLAQIKAGCIERKVPKEYWHKVGQHYLGEKARKRLDEVKLVMKNMHGGKYKWNWKTFKIAMRNMGWDIDPSTMETIKVKSKPSGLWWIVGKGDEPREVSPPAVPPKPQPQKSKSMSEVVTRSTLPTPKRSATTNSIETVSSIASSVFSSKSATSKSTPASTPAAITPDESSDAPTTITHAPLWLVNACQSLEQLTTDHPRVMTALSAILVTVGSLPALPAISAGAGGAFLASSTAHALGSLAVGLGTLLKAQADGQVQVSGPVSPPQKT